MSACLDFGVGRRAKQHKLATALQGAPGCVLDQVQACRCMDLSGKAVPSGIGEWEAAGKHEVPDRSSHRPSLQDSEHVAVPLVLCHTEAIG